MVDHAERLKSFVEISPTGCWNWTRHLKKDGYGQFTINGTQMPLQRAAYLLFIGPIPDGMTIDHLCRNRRCANPEHLEAVTAVVNVMRGESPPAQNARKTSCVNGHPFDDKNTYRINGRRNCRPCNLAAQKRRQQKGLRA